MATYKSIKYIIPVEAVEHTDSINALSDVDTVTTAPADGQILKWNNANSKWYPGDVEESVSGTQKAIFGFGSSSGNTNPTSVTNLVSSSGVVATDTTGVGTGRRNLAAAGYGGDKALFGFGNTGSNPFKTNVTNLVSNTGVVGSDQTGVGSSRNNLSAAGYGEDKAIFGFGYASGSGRVNMTNLVSNAGVVATDTTGVGLARQDSAAAGYGGDKAIFGFGHDNFYQSITNLVSSSGVVATDTTGVGSVKMGLAAAGYGGDKAIFGFGHSLYPTAYGYDTETTNTTNLVSNTGVVATDTTGVGTDRRYLAAAGYGGDKAIFGFGNALGGGASNKTNVTNLVSNTGVVATDTTGVGSAQYGSAAAGYSTTA